MRRLLPALIGIGYLLPFGAVNGQASSLSANDQEMWRRDLELVRTVLPERHPNLFHSVSRDSFDSSLVSLSSILSTLNRPAAIAALMKIIASVGEGHTNVIPFIFDAKMSRLPIRMRAYVDGVFVVDADSSHQHLIGGEVRRIGRLPASEAMSRIGEFMGAESETFTRYFASGYLSIPELLRAADVVDRVERVVIELNTEGNGQLIELIPLNGPGQHSRAVPFDTRLLADSTTLVIDYRAVANNDEESNAEFFGRVFREAARIGSRAKIVIDLRNNGGGDNTLNSHLVREIIGSPQVDRSDRLFVLIGGGTYSAAINLVSALDRYTNATFIGEPTGAGVNHYGDAESMVLPHTQVVIRHSTSYYSEAPRDRRSSFYPDLYAPLTGRAVSDDTDPAIDLLSHLPPTISEQIHLAMTSGDTLLGDVLAQMRDDPVRRYAEVEAEINSIGYNMLAGGNHQVAVLVFRANTVAFPTSANTWDSYGEALVGAGRHPEAIESFERALRLDPDLNSSREWLSRLRGAGDLPH